MRFSRIWLRDCLILLKIYFFLLCCYSIFVILVLIFFTHTAIHASVFPSYICSHIIMIRHISCFYYADTKFNILLIYPFLIIITSSSIIIINHIIITIFIHGNGDVFSILAKALKGLFFF